MAGQPDPTPLTEAFARTATVCTQAAPVAGGKATIPLSIQDVAGGATFDAGFPAANFTDPASGGIPPFGVAFNGLFFQITSNGAAVGAGQLALWNSGLSTSMTGYRQGAVLTKVARTGLWFNLLDGNTSNPDSSGANWLSWIPVGSDYMSANLASGSTNNWNPTGFNPSIGFLDVNPNAGASTLTGLIAGANGQTVTISNVNNTNNLTLNALDGSSSSANQFRAFANMTLLPNQSVMVRYSTGANVWIVVP